MLSWPQCIIHFTYLGINLRDTANRLLAGGTQISVCPNERNQWNFAMTYPITISAVACINYPIFPKQILSKDAQHAKRLMEHPRKK